MNIKVFTLRFNDVEGKFDDSELTAFGGDPNHPRDVVDVSEHFFIHDRSPTWIMLVMYKDVPKPGAHRWPPSSSTKNASCSDSNVSFGLAATARVRTPLSSFIRRSLGEGGQTKLVCLACRTPPFGRTSRRCLPLMLAGVLTKASSMST